MLENFLDDRNQKLKKIYKWGVLMTRASNDATLSKLGDIYQYYISLLECFKMDENEKFKLK